MTDGRSDASGEERRVIARETIEITLEVREGDIYEFWAKTDEFDHFHASNEGLDAIRRVLVNDPRTVIDGRGLLTITGEDYSELWGVDRTDRDEIDTDHPDLRGDCKDIMEESDD